MLKVILKKKKDDFFKEKNKKTKKKILFFLPRLPTVSNSYPHRATEQSSLPLLNGTWQSLTARREFPVTAL